MKKKKLTTKEKGITLVALIITIIVLIILAAVTIFAFIESGLLQTASKGTENYANAQNYEQEIMDNLDKHAQNVVRNITKTTEIIQSVDFIPNGSEKYEQEHSVKVEVKGNIQNVTNIKYQWLNTTEEPEEDTFIEFVSNGETITKDKVNGTWYLWTLFETNDGKKNIVRSNGFNFDNEGPTVTLESTPVSGTSFILTAIASDEYNEIEKYLFYVDDEMVQEYSYPNNTYNCLRESTFKGNCMVRVFDTIGNSSTAVCTGETLLHTWYKYNSNIVSATYEERKIEMTGITNSCSRNPPSLNKRH